VKDGGAPSAAASRRLDQWLWFARLAKSRSLAARLCVTGAVTVNQIAVSKANHLVRIGDTVTVPQGAVRRSVRLVALGIRRGPPAEARLLYEEVAAPARVPRSAPAWVPLLVVEDEVQNQDR